MNIREFRINFVYKIIAYTLFFLGIFVFVLPVDVQAVQCCIVEQATKRTDSVTTVSSYSVDGCRLKESTACNTTPRESECLDLPNSRRCTVTREREIDCLEHIRCRDKVIETISNCQNLSAIQCETGDNGNNCFLVNGSCYALVDRNICDKIRESATCDKSKACSWENGRCLTVLESTLSDRFDTTDTGDILTKCSITGTCRDVNDILVLVLNVSASLFSVLGVLGFVMFIYGGMIMILSFGNPERFKKGQMALVSAIVGIVIAFSAYLLVNFLLESFGVDATFRAIL
jgi:hypothetical protein